MVVFFLDGTAMQILLQMVISGVFIIVFHELKPYTDKSNVFLAITSQWCLLLIFLFAFVDKVGMVAVDNDLYDKSVLEGILIFVTLLPVVLVVLQVLVEVAPVRVT